MTKKKNCIALLIIFLQFTINAEAQGNNPTAEQIIQRSVNNAGGERRLDSLVAVETVSRVITSQKDTLSLAVKRSGHDYYYVSVLGKAHSSQTTIYNKGSAVKLKDDSASQIYDPVQLEQLRLQTYVSLDHGYKKLGYRFERLEDQHFTNTDLYQLKVTSPLGISTLNYYEKRTGNLTMIAYDNGNKTIITDYHKEDGLAYPSEIMMVDTLNNLTRSVINFISFRGDIDPDWFHLPATGIATVPAELRTGEFVYVGANAGSVISRDEQMQVESNAESRIEYRVKWESGNSYQLYDLKDPASMPVTANIRDITVKVSSWQGKRYYCHYMTSGNDGGTCVFEKIR